MDLVIKMDMKKTYKICISSKENLMDTILNEIDQLRYAKNIQNPIVELCFQGFKLNAKEIYSLFDELVVHKEIVIANISFENSSNNEDNTSSTNVKKLICGKTYQPEGYMNEYWEMKFKNDILDTLYINIIVDYTKVGVEPTEEFREELERYYKDTMVGYNVTVWKNGGSLDIRLTSDYQTLIKYGAETDDFLYQTLVNDMQSDGYYCS